MNESHKTMVIIDQKTLIVKLIRKLEEENFYGELILQLERGNIVSIRREETLKLKDL